MGILEKRYNNGNWCFLSTEILLLFFQFKSNFEHLSPCAVPNPVTNNRVNSAVPNTNKVNKNELVLKNLAAEASQYMTYNWSGIQEAESKYQIYLASQRKACKVFIICFFCIADVSHFGAALDTVSQVFWRMNSIRTQHCEWNLVNLKSVKPWIVTITSFIPWSTQF